MKNHVAWPANASVVPIPWSLHSYNPRFYFLNIFKRRAFDAAKLSALDFIPGAADETKSLVTNKALSSPDEPAAEEPRAW